MGKVNVDYTIGWVMGSLGFAIYAVAAGLGAPLLLRIAIGGTLYYGGLWLAEKL